MRVGIPHIYNPKLTVGVIVPRVNWHPKPKSQRLSLWDDRQANLVPASSPKVSFMRPAPQYTCQSRPVFFRAGKPDCHSPDNGASFIKIRGNGYIGSNAFADPCVTESKQVSVIRLVVIVGILRTAETQI